MALIEQKLEKACQDLDIQGAVLVAGSADGKYRYEKAFGVRSLKNPSPMKLDNTMWLASCTKLMTTVAAMQCVEKGLLKLDEDVTSILSELKGREVLEGFEEESGKPILKPNTKPITLRHLLTHQSGIAYDVFEPRLMQYRAYQKRTVGMATSFEKSTPIEAADFPLLFEPGAAWAYSVGVDLAGEMVSRVNGDITLEQYLEKNVWGPLGMNSMTFHPASTPAVKEKLVDMVVHPGGITVFGTAAEPNAKVEHTDETVWSHKTVHCHGGGGGYGSVLDYQKLLQSLCADDEKVLKSATLTEMFKPQLTDEAREAFAFVRTVGPTNDLFGGIPLDVKTDWGIGGMINTAAYPGRSAGSMAWGGYPNLIWWVDRAAGMSGILGTQITQPGDEKVVKWTSEWAKEIYHKAGVKQTL